jgi:SAM-dependent methyltransferase
MYSMYAKYYDKLNKDYEYWIPFIKSQIPNKLINKNMIEFGCGTGNVLSYFKNEYKLYGVDISEDMLKHAKEKLPDAELINIDMVHYCSPNKYQIALCLFDSINHILNFDDWKVFFKNVSNSLIKGGVFILDANTTDRLSMITKRPAYFSEFDNNYFYMKLIQKSTSNFIFDVRVLKRINDKILEEEREEIEETTEKGATIYAALKEAFSVVKVFNEKKEEIESNQFQEIEKHRWFFSCRK